MAINVFSASSPYHDLMSKHWQLERPTLFLPQCTHVVAKWKVSILSWTQLTLRVFFFFRKEASRTFHHSPLKLGPDQVLIKWSWCWFRSAFVAQRHLRDVWTANFQIWILGGFDVFMSVPMCSSLGFSRHITGYISFQCRNLKKVWVRPRKRTTNQFQLSPLFSAFVPPFEIFFILQWRKYSATAKFCHFGEVKRYYKAKKQVFVIQRLHRICFSILPFTQCMVSHKLDS